ncbi:HGGxSTG domain-containing protein [Roseovarius sp. THAF9]|uniref:HGGxSTG domain-containing protein n=1 Tax=Roseovarius sp. THAF9 TaxID=2587847 RepID=UPI0034A38DF6
MRPACGAKSKTGELCEEPVVAGKRRCRIHGGLSTGPKTKEGRERVRAVQHERWSQSR